ncbi:hypothetical protein [Floccifex sp.]|uniref:hypothetical protein n=1 Tax=Floccifex sp. TaxID=2815810 RepID=UPI002A75C196|nr:hypothetical protein [Floccifex sp.]MDY2958370.1 hypothetical protein [Floccifex sp.]
MRLRKIFKSSQDQAVAAWIEEVKNIRIANMKVLLDDQALNLRSSLEELSKLKEFIGDPDHILGSPLTKHGEIAEHVQVNFSNADRLLVGKSRNHSIDVGRTAMEDYLRNGKMVQSKFYNGEKGTFNAVVKHLEKYPDFIKQGGNYDIPKDQYDQLMDIYNRGETARYSLNRSEETLFKNMKNWEVEKHVKVNKVIHPSEVDYKDVQTGVVDKVVDKKERSIERKNEDIENNIRYEHRPTLKEGLQTTAVAATLEGGTTFCLKIYEKHKNGKKLSEFTSDDWKDVGIDTAKGTAKGTIRGSTVYAMTNFVGTHAPVANSLVTATFGVVSLARKFEKKEITGEEFAMSSEIVCLDVGMSALSSIIGQTLIPVPVLGAIVGNTVGMFMVEIAKNYLDADEQKLIKQYVSQMNELDKKYKKEYERVLRNIQKKEQKFDSLIELAFDEDVNKAFEASIELAYSEGVEKDSLLKNMDEIDSYFMN